MKIFILLLSFATVAFGADSCELNQIDKIVARIVSFKEYRRNFPENTGEINKFCK